MKRITFLLPDALYSELEQVAAEADERGYNAEKWANDLIASELAARRLPKVSQEMRQIQ
jgi:hypothetical protein